MESKRNQRFNFHCRINDTLADLIDRMLTMDPKQRITGNEALNHAFFKEAPSACTPSE